MVQPLKFESGKVISSHILHGMNWIGLHLFYDDRRDVLLDVLTTTKGLSQLLITVRELIPIRNFMKYSTVHVR